MMGKDVTDFQDDIRRYRLPNTNKIHVVLGMNSEYMTAENGMKYYQALCLIKGLSQEDIDTKNERWLQYVLLLDMAKDWEKKDEIFLAELCCTDRQTECRQIYADELPDRGEDCHYLA